MPSGFSALAGQAELDPVQFSVTSQAPAAGRQGVLEDLKGLAGQAALLPVQVAGRSQTPLAARHCVLLARKPSIGHIVLAPLHVSGASHGPFAERQTKLADAWVVPQVPLLAAPFAALQAWQSVSLLPPQALVQQTPSAQKVLAHSPPVVQGTPRGARFSTAPRSQVVAPRARPR